MPVEQTIIAVTALLAGLLLVGLVLAGSSARSANAAPGRPLPARSSPVDPPLPAETADGTLRVVWWLTIAIVLLGVGMSGSFAADQAPIFALGAAAVMVVVVLHELASFVGRGSLARLVELLVAIGLIGGLLVLTGWASSPFTMLFALVAVAAALAGGPGAGILAAALATAAFAAVLLVDPAFATYGPADALQLSVGIGATWLLAFVAIAYGAHQRRAVSQAIALSRTDPLTGLSNRSQLFATLEQEVSRTRRSERGFCVLMIDLDGLKAINDTAGHLRGDDVLRALGRIINGSIRAVDSAYRFGGDEFVVLLPETDIIGAFVVAEKIRMGAEELGVAAGGPESLTSVSIGLVSHPEDGLTAEELMIAADRAMYQAKRLGKNQISGNPRPRPALLGRRGTAEPPSRPPVEASRASTVEPAAPIARNGATAPRDDRAVAVELGSVVVAGESSAPGAAQRGDAEEEDADPAEVRRRIATASRSFDPDDQVRRAMDAFFSPSTEAERAARDH